MEWRGETTLTQVISISSKILALTFTAVLLASSASAYYFNDDGGITTSGTGDGWMNIQSYENQSQLVSELIAPFLFITVLLQFTFTRVLSFILDDNEKYPSNIWRDDKPKVRKEATVMAITIAAMLVVSPYWTWIRTIARSIGLIAALMLLAVILYLGYVFFYK